MKPQAATVVPLPAWVKPEAPNRLAIYEAAALMGVEGQWIRMAAADQRALMGFPVFGKQAFRVLDDGTIEVARSTCFGADCEIGQYNPARVLAAAVHFKRLAPGYFGPAYA